MSLRNEYVRHDIDSRNLNKLGAKETWERQVRLLIAMCDQLTAHKQDLKGNVLDNAVQSDILNIRQRLQTNLDILLGEE